MRELKALAVRAETQRLNLAHAAEALFEKIIFKGHYFGGDISLPADDDFAEMVAGQEELHRLKILEQFFKTAIVENLSRLPPSSRSELDGAMAMNAEGVTRHGFGALLV